MSTLILILLSAVINTTAQLLLKAGADKLKISSWSFQHWGDLLLQLSSNPYLILGCACYVSSVLVWIIVLSRVPVSFAYPMGSIAYVITAIAAVLIFNESLSLTRIIGILVIIFGVYLITRTG